MLHKDLVFLEPYEGTKLPPKRLALIFSIIAILLIAGFGIFSYWEEVEKTNLEIEAFLEPDIENSKEESFSIVEKSPTKSPSDTTISHETDKKLNDSIAEPVVPAESEKTGKNDTKLVPLE